MDLSKISGKEVSITPIESRVKGYTSKSTDGKAQAEILPSPGKKIDEKETKQMVDTLNNMLGMTPTHLKFKYHEKTGEYYVQLVNDHSNEVVKEIPSKKMLDISAAMQDFLGIIVNKKA